MIVVLLAAFFLLLSSSIAVSFTAGASNHPGKGPATDVELGLDPSIGDRLSTPSPDITLSDALNQFVVNAEEDELIPVLVRYAFYPPLPDEIEVEHAYDHWPLLAMKVTAEQARELTRLPGVTGIYLDQKMELATWNNPESFGLPAPQRVPVPGETFPFMGEYPALLSDTIGIVGASPLHAQGNTGEGVIIAILDTGIDTTHPNLDDLDDDPFTFDPKVILQVDFSGTGPVDFVGHGTHVAGIAAGTGEAGSDGFVDGFFGGIAAFPIAPGTQKGVAPGAFLYDVKVCGFVFCFESDIIAGIEFAIDNGADVISMSLGGFPLLPEEDPVFAAVETAVEAGLTVVVAAGNSGPSGYSITSPGTAPNVITVGATYETDIHVFFSSRGPSIIDEAKPDVVAPGFQVVSALSSTSFFFFAPPGIRYLAISGTSMSTPHVSGAAALLISAFPGASPHSVKAALMRGADDIGLDGTIQGAGRLNVAAALATMDAAPKGFFEVPIPVKTSPAFGVGPVVTSSRVVLVESPHPYPNLFFDEQVITEPGALQIRAHFPVIDVESFFDFVVVLDGEGNFVAFYTGLLFDVTTPFADGDTLRILLITDSSVTRFGYVLDRIDFKKPPITMRLRGPTYAYDGSGTDVTVFLDVENLGETTESLDVVFTAFDIFGFPVGTKIDAVEDIAPGESRSLEFAFFAVATFAAEVFRVTAEVTLRAAPAAPAALFLFGTDARGGNLIVVDTTTGEGTRVGDTRIGRLPSLAFDPTTGVLYGGGGGGAPFIWIIDPATALSAFLGDTGLGFAAVGGLDFTPDGTLFASVNIAGDGGTGSDHLAIIDKFTGLATVIGPYGECTGVEIPSFGGGSCSIEGVEGIAFAPDGTLYASSGGRGAELTGGPTLFTVDPTSGSATPVGPILDSDGFPLFGGIVSLQFAPDGTLFGGTGGGIGDLLVIDPATAVFTRIGNAVPSSSLGGLALCPEAVITCPLPTGGPSTTGSTTVLLLDKVARRGDNPLISTLSPDKVDSLSAPHIVLFPGDFNVFEVTALTSDALVGAELRIVGDVAEVASFSSAPEIASRSSLDFFFFTLLDPVPIFFNFGPQFDAGDTFALGDFTGQASAPVQIVIPEDENGESNGEFSGEIQLVAGGEVLARTPIDIQIDEPEARILFDDVFQDLFDAERLWGGGFLALGVTEWWRIVAEAGFDVDSLRQTMASRDLDDPWTVLLSREFSTVYLHDTELHDIRRANFAQLVGEGDSVVALYDFGFENQVLFDELQLDCTVRFFFGFAFRDCNFVSDFALIDAFDPEHPITQGLTTLPLISAPFTLAVQSPAQAVAGAATIGLPESSGIVLGTLESEAQGKFISMGDSNIFDFQLSAPDLTWIDFFFFADVDISPFQNEGDLAVNLLEFATNDPPDLEDVRLDRTAARPGESITVTFDVADAVRVEVSLIDPEGELVTRLVVDPSVVNSVTLTVPAGAAAGVYEVRVTAVDEMDDYAWALEFIRIEGSVEGLLLSLTLWAALAAGGIMGLLWFLRRKSRGARVGRVGPGDRETTRREGPGSE